MFGFLISAIKIVFLLGFLVFIHECGHFFVAKLCKVKVNEFAIGFGPTILKKQGKVTKYALRLIPLGGFVSMEGEDERSQEEGSFSETSIIKRILIVMAGGLVNILFAILMFWILSIIVLGFKNSFINVAYFLKETVKSLVQLFTGKMSMDNMVGPVGISSVVSKTSGLFDFAYIMTLISLSLGITNLLPFPPLDGGKVVLLIIEAIRKKPLNQKIEVAIQSIGFIALITLSVFVTYNDILKLR
ncbi:MAG: site-2 protease family protein [Clostridia bacterium]|nr:site-2 protease family protein [Clostridia bacterium]